MSLWSHRTPAVAGLLSCFACCYSPFNGSQRLGRGFHSKKLQSRCEPAVNRPPRGGQPPDCHRIPSRRQASGDGRPSDKIEHPFRVPGVSGRGRIGDHGASPVTTASRASLFQVAGTGTRRNSPQRRLSLRAPNGGTVATDRATKTARRGRSSSPSHTRPGSCTLRSPSGSPRLESRRSHKPQTKAGRRSGGAPAHCRISRDCAFPRRSENSRT